MMRKILYLLLAFCLYKSVASNKSVIPLINAPPSSTSAYYCNSRSGSSPFQGVFYIESVQLGSINWDTGYSNYSDWTWLNTNLTKGEHHEITIITVSFPSVLDRTSLNGYSIWIDYNQDYDFDDEGEQIFFTTDTIFRHEDIHTITVTFSIPTDATLGPTRMRISMETTKIPSSCGTFNNNGEVEDYTVIIQN